MIHIREWGVSLAVHSLLLLALFSLHVEYSGKPALVQVISSITEPPETEDFLEVVPNLDEEISLSEAVSLIPKSAASVAAAQAPMPTELLQTNLQQQAMARVRDPSLNRPLANLGSAMKLGENIDGVRGANLNAGGDSGSVDRITMEILRQLEKSKVLVAWVMDSTESMAKRREDVIKRFERIYHELGELEKNKEDILLTSIVSFGIKTEFVTPRPTANMEEIRKAVRSIKTDDSGKENVFSAVKETCLKLRRYQTQSGRKLMIIVLTDEKGDDPSLADDTIKLVTRNRTPVYVLGPMAPFCRKTVEIPYREPESGEVFMLPVEMGPETIQVEQLTLPYWGAGPQYDLLPSGFGPYDLTRLARESGGIYFMYDDGTTGKGNFNTYEIAPYSPTYVSTAEYRKEIASHPLRQAIIQAAEDSRNLQEAVRARGGGQEPALQFGVADINTRLAAEQQKVALTLAFVEQALARLRAVEKERDKETSKRWQAHYDLMMGRLLATKVRCNEYNWRTGQMRVTPKIPTGKTKDGKPNNSWRLAPDTNISFGLREQPASKDTKAKDAKAKDDSAQTNVKKSDPKATAKAKEEAQQALAYLRRVSEEHAGTPWALLAQRESESPMGFKWEEIYVEPPQPPSPEQAARAQRRAEAMKKIPKGL